MSNLFTQSNIEAFLKGEGRKDANFVAAFTMDAVRLLATGATIESQTSGDDASYSASLSNANGNIDLKYTVKRLSAGFNEHNVEVTHGEGKFSVNRLIFMAESAKVEEVVAPVVEEVVAPVVEEVTAPEVVEEVVAPVVEEVVEAPVEEIVKAPEAAAKPKKAAKKK
jgi:hypothetical protein